MTTTPKPAFVPPYVSWTTLINLLNKLGEGALPNRIDKGLLDTYSGATQAQVLSTMRGLDMIGDNGKIQPRLIRLVNEPDQRKGVWREILDQYYHEQMKLAEQNATAQQLWESFQKYEFKGSTLRKAIVFYLKAVEFAEAPTSQFFKAPKAQQSKSGNRKTKIAQPKPDTFDVNEAETSDIDFQKLTLPSGGSFRFSIDVDLYRLSEQEREFIFGLIDQIRDFEDSIGEADLDEDEDDDF